jgi:hypothetical protein
MTGSTEGPASVEACSRRYVKSPIVPVAIALRSAMRVRVQADPGLAE